MSYRFVVLAGSAEGTQVPFDGKQLLVVGSSSKADIRLKDEGVAKRHAQIFMHDSGPAVIDMSGRKFGVNGKRKRQARIKVGDKIQFGAAIIQLEDETKSATEESPVPKAGVRILTGDRSGQSVMINHEAVFGRLDTVDITIPDLRCSRRHCAIQWRGGRFVVMDRSSNGTWLNDARLKPKVRTPIESGDVLRIGATEIEFRVDGVPIRKRKKKKKAEAAADGPPTGDYDFGSPEPQPQPKVVETKPVVQPVGDFEFDFGDMAPVASGGAETAAAGDEFEFDFGGAAAPAADGGMSYEFDFADAALPDSGMTTITSSSKGDDISKYATQRLPRIKKEVDESSSSWVASALAGNLQKMPFTQVVQFLNMSQMTGELEITAPQGTFQVGFQAGNVVDVVGVPGQTGAQDGFFKLVFCKVGQFSFHQDRQPQQTNITTNTMSLLMDAMRMVDERGG